MQKFLRKRRKGGFTLIELIVVIAILAILAAIAIPRFAGFTDRAKINNDEQYAALVGNTIITLISSGDLAGAGNVSIAADGTVTSTAVTVAKTTLGSTLDEIVQTMITKKPTAYYSSLTVTTTATGTHSLTARGAKKS